MAKGKRFVRRKPGNNGALQRRAQKQKTQDADVSMIASTVNSDSESDLDGQTRVRKRVRWDAVEEGIQDDGAEKESADAGSVRDDDTVEADEGVDEKVVLAIFCQNHRIGCAYYDPVRLMICVLEDTSESSHNDITKLLLEQVSPDVTLTSSKGDDAAMDVMRDAMEESGGFFQVCLAKDFATFKGRERLLALGCLSELPAECLESSSTLESDPPSNAYDFMRRRRAIAGDPTMKRWNASIRVGNFASLESSPLCIGSVGALIDHLTKIRAMADMDDVAEGGLEVRGIESIALDQVMQINADALSSLQVFDTESHASIHSDKTKEGLSLFGTLNMTQTTLGRVLLRQWLLRPSMALSIINARHDAVECLIRSENISSADNMHGHLKGLKNIPRILRQLKCGKAGLHDWQGLVKFTFHAALLRESLGELSYAADVDLFKNLVSILDVTRFREVGNAVHETIDWEESLSSGRVCVRPQIDEELDNWKHIYHGIDGVLSHVAEQICETVPTDYTDSLNVVYFPQLGFLICVPMQDNWRSESGIDVLDGWVFQFSSESHVYFKSEQMNDMDHHIGDLHSNIVDREIEIVQALLEKILNFDDAIAQACDACAELDCLLCFANATRLYNYCRPMMTEENIIDVRQGRHPLQEQVVDTFVPNDVSVKGGLGLGVEQEDTPLEQNETSFLGGNSVVILTGANACGKSVYLKQTALIQYMAQIGCFVPAEEATLGIVDRIFTRVQTRESVSKIQSAFMIDLNQVSLALRHSTPRSLILLDEFGKGTISSDGAGLLCGVLHSFLSRGSGCPKILAATHFHDLFREDLLSRTLPISFLHMQILLTASNEDGEDLDSEEGSQARSGQQAANRIRVRNGETLTYLYRVAEGLALDSHAAECAKMFGLPLPIVERAQYVSSLLANHDVTRLLDESMTPAQEREMQDAEAVCRRFLAWNLEDFDVDTNASKGGVKAKLAEILGRSLDDDVGDDD